MNLDSELKRTWLVAVLAMGTVSNAIGQDPFEDADFGSNPDAAIDSPFGDANGTNSMEEASTDDLEDPNAGFSAAQPIVAPSSETNAVVKSLLANPPSSPSELGRAIQLMSRIRRWDEVGRWLNAADKAGITEASAAAMVDTAGIDVFQRLTTPLVALPDSQKDIARKVITLANAHRQNPKTIQQAVAVLQNGKPKDWTKAFRTLQGSGYLGIEIFFQSVMAGGAPVPNQVMGEALRKLGPSARDAWLVAIRTPHEDVKANLLTLAANSKSTELQRQLASIFSDKDALPQSVHALADKWLSQKKLNDDTGARIQVAEQADSQLIAWLKAYANLKYESDEATEIRWELDPTGRILKSVSCRPSEMLWQRVLSEAANVLHTDNGLSRANALATAVVLQTADGTKDESEVLNSANIKENEFDQYEFACMVWDAATQYDLPTAQARVLQKLARFSVPMPIEVRDRLVAGLDSGYRPVRYMAASALMQAIQEGRAKGVDNGSFQGRGRLDRVVLEMTQIRPNRQVFIVGGSDSLRTHVRSLLEQFGYSCEEYSNGRSLIARCKEGAPIDEIYVVHRVYEMEFIELLQRIRGTASGAKVPVAMLADSLSSRELDFLHTDLRVKMGSIPPEVSDFDPVVRSMRVLGQGMELAEEARLLWRDEAQEFRDSLKAPAVVPTRASLAASVPQSPLGQKELILKAIDANLAVSDREQASQLFVQSVRQFGLQISSETADQLYDVYNDRAKSEIELRSSLGRILDAIEANRGEREWDAVRP